MRAIELERYRSLFVGNEAAFAEQHDDGSYTPHRRPLTDEDVKRHLKGEWTLGLYTVRPGTNDTKLLVIDIDTKSKAPEDTARLVVTLRGLFHQQWLVELSGLKGTHTWLFLEDWMPADLARKAGQALLRLAGLPPATETWPKQAEVTELGNLIKLPMGYHRKAKRWSKWVDYGWQWREVQPVTRAEIEHLAGQLPELSRPTPARRGDYTPDPNAPLVPCMERLLERGIEEGNRHNALVSLALFCKSQDKPEADALELVERAWETMGSPGSRNHIVQLVRSVYAGLLKGLRCESQHLHLSPEPLCSMKCPRYTAIAGLNLPATND